MPRIFAAFLAALFLLSPTSGAAHDIPNDVVVQAFVKPQGNRLHLVVRVPLKAMRDINFLERGPGYLDLARVNEVLPGAATLWISDFIELFENDSRLSKPQIVATRISLPSDRSFASYDNALANVTGPPLSNDTNVYWDQTMLDVLFEYPIQSEQSRFSIHPALARLGLRVVTVLRFVPPSGEVRAFEFTGDPGLVRLDPRWYQAALRFVDLGFFHILDGTDHLLFLLCLVIPFRRLGALIPVVTAFTIAHSITLIASAYNLAPNFLWFPPLIETLIAISIVYMALENIVGGSSLQRRWMMAFGFGLVHGFGFSFALRESLQFAGSHLLTSLLSFNVGVELGQLLPLRHRGTHGRDRSVGARRSYRLALDAGPRARSRAVPVPMAGAHRRIAGKRCALADDAFAAGRRAVVFAKNISTLGGSRARFRLESLRGKIWNRRQRHRAIRAQRWFPRSGTRSVRRSR